MPYSTITKLLRRIHGAMQRSERTGIPPREILEQDLELRRRLAQEHVQRQARRGFLVQAGLAGAALGAGGLARNVAAAAGGLREGRDPGRVAIIGAGAGGLRTAHRLHQYGWASTVYEANSRIGGRMYSNSDYFTGGRVVEWGGELISTEHTSLRNLAHQLNLELEDANKSSAGEEEVYLIDGVLRSEADLLAEWLGGLYELMKRAQQEAPWQPFYNAYTEAHRRYDWTEAGDWLATNGIGRDRWVHKLLMSDLVSEYGLIGNNSALNLIYLLGWSTRRSGGLPLAGTDERFHVVGGNDRVILIRSIDIDARIWSAFSSPKRASIANIKPADNGKLQLEFTSRYYDVSRVVSGQLVHLGAVAYSDSGTAKAPGFISTWEGNPGSPSELGIIVNYTGGYAGETLRDATAIPGAQAPYFGQAAEKDVARVLADFDKIWPGIKSRYTGRALVSNWWDNPYSRGAFISPDIGAMTSWWGAQLEREGNIHFAGEACDLEYWSYMNGAIRSGERVAQEIAQG